MRGSHMIVKPIIAARPFIASAKETKPVLELPRYSNSSSKTGSGFDSSRIGSLYLGAYGPGLQLASMAAGSSVERSLYIMVSERCLERCN